MWKPSAGLFFSSLLLHGGGYSPRYSHLSHVHTSTWIECMLFCFCTSFSLSSSVPSTCKRKRAAQCGKTARVCASQCSSHGRCCSSEAVDLFAQFVLDRFDPACTQHAACNNIQPSSRSTAPILRRRTPGQCRSSTRRAWYSAVLVPWHAVVRRALVRGCGQLWPV